MNALFQEYKKQSDECKVVFVDELPLEFEIKTAIVAIDEQGKIETYSRAKEKRETQRLVKDYYEHEK